MLKKLVLTACLLLACSYCLAQEATAKAASVETKEKAVAAKECADNKNIIGAHKVIVDTKDIPVVKKVPLVVHVGYDDYCDAWKSYHKALKNYADVPKRTAAFNDALKAIGLANSKEPDNPGYWLLGAQIYRSRGGVGFAKNYFAKACGLYEQKLQEFPESISFNLQYAVACYAGDAQFYEDYSSYKTKAVKNARKALQLINDTETKPECQWILELVEDDLVEQKFLAYIILHDDKKLSKLSEQIKRKYEESQPQYTMVADYEKIVADGSWHWKVSSKDGAEKAFLLYYLRDWVN